jgi:ankyrin repeat protein
MAAYFGRLEVARLLLERGADRNPVSSNDSRVTPLHSAVSARHRDLAGLLLALGASANAVQKGGSTPLHTAAHNGDEDIVDLLLLRGADPTRPADDGRTPPDMADEGGHAALADMLREASRA